MKKLFFALFLTCTVFALNQDVPDFPAREDLPEPATRNRCRGIELNLAQCGAVRKWQPILPTK